MADPAPPDAREQACSPVPLPADMAAIVAGRVWRRDLVGEAGAAVYRLSGPADDLFLKHGCGEVAGDVRDEMARAVWLAPHLPVPALVRFACTPAEAWLLMTAIEGRTASQALAAADAPERLEIVAALAGFLGRFHALPVDRCPFKADHRLRLADARRRLDAGLVDEGDFGDEHRGWSATRVWDAMVALPRFAPDPVVTHGDFSLDNIVMQGTAVAGCLDLGRVGVADRYQDLAILHDCLGEFGEDVAAALWPAYGIAAPDEDRRRFHLMLDEFF